MKQIGIILLSINRCVTVCRMVAWRLRLAHLGAGTEIYPYARIYRPRLVRIGSQVSINDFVHIRGAGGVEIGDATIIAPHVTITSQSHDIGALTQGKLYRDTRADLPVIIGKNVWIGAGAIILPGVNIGDGAVIGAGALVNSDVSGSTLFVGQPARPIRQLK